MSSLINFFMCIKEFYKRQQNAIIAQQPQAVHEECTLMQLGYTFDIPDWQSYDVAKERSLDEQIAILEAIEGETNIVLQIDACEFECHANLLNLHCAGLKLSNKITAIRLNSVVITPAAFRIVYDWMQAEKPQLPRENFMAVLLAAHHLKANKLLEQCLDMLSENGPFRENTAFMLFIEASQAEARLTNIVNNLLLRVGKFFLTLVATKHFLQLDAFELKLLLMSNNIAINSESEVLYAVLRWLEGNWPKRCQFSNELMRCVRFDNMSLGNVCACLTFTIEPPLLRKICAEPEISDLLWVAARLKTAALFTTEQGAGDPIVPQSPDRCWIYDPRASYHSTTKTPKDTTRPTYREFKNYLHAICEGDAYYWKEL